MYLRWLMDTCDVTHSYVRTFFWSFFSLTSRFFVNSQLDHFRAWIPACSLTAALLHRCFPSNLSTTTQEAIVKLRKLRTFWGMLGGRWVCYTGEFLHQHTHLRTQSLQVMHICVYVCMCLYACICMWMRMCVYDIAWHVETLLLGFSICAYVCICMRMCMCVHVCVYSACVYVYICIYVCLCICMHIHLYTRACGCTYALV